MSTPPPRLRDTDPRFARLAATLDRSEPDASLVAKVLAIPDEAPLTEGLDPAPVRTRPSYGRWLVAGACALTLAGLGLWLAERPNAEPRVPAPLPEQVMEAPATATPAEAPVRDENAPVVSVQDLPAAPELSARRQLATSSAAKPSASASERSTFHEELALVEAARSALGRGEVRSCLEALDQYDQRFRDGVLSSEADITRIEAFAKLGRDDEARALADRFLVVHATSPYAERVRALRTKLGGARKDTVQ